MELELKQKELETALNRLNAQADSFFTPNIGGGDYRTSRSPGPAEQEEPSHFIKEKDERL